MPLTLKPGSRLFSVVCATEMIAVRAPTDEVEITIGGVAPALSADDRDPSASLVEGYGGGTGMGKRYVDDADTVELLCIKAGDGVPALDGEPLHLKEAKPLPASD